MRSGALILFLLICTSAVSRVAADGSPTDFSLGNKILKKQEECEDMISETIDEMLEDERFNPHIDIPIADDNYHNCKQELDKLKREYMTANNIGKTIDTGFFPVRINEETSELVSLPADEGSEIRDLEFDVNEELCVTDKKCKNILVVVDRENEEDKRHKEIFYHCHVLLETIKQKFIHEKNLDEKKLKAAGGWSVTCMGQPVMMDLPSSMNNLDYHILPHELFGDAFKGDSTHQDLQESSPAFETPAIDRQKLQDHTPEEEKQEDHSKHDEHISKHVKGSTSNAYLAHANPFYCILFIFVLVTI